MRGGFVFCVIHRFITAPHCKWISWASGLLLILPGKVRRLVWGDSVGIMFGVINVPFILKCGITTNNPIVLKTRLQFTSFLSITYMAWLKMFILDFISYVF